MQGEEVQRNSGSTSSPNPLAGFADQGLQGIPVMRSGPRLPLWLLTLGAGLVAGFLSWAGGEAANDLFKLREAIVYPPNYKQIGGYQKMAVDAEIQGKAKVVVVRKNTTVAFGFLGLVLGVSLGLMGGLASGSARTAVSGAVGGGIAGASVGSGLSYAIVPLFFRYLDPEQGLLILFLTHAAIFAGIGATSGLALGLGLENRSAMVRAVFGGMLGALIGTFAFETANSLAFPLMRTYEPISTEWLPRLLTHLCVATFTALLAGLAAGRPAENSASKAIA
jgi:hypothetical protein